MNDEKAENALASMPRRLFWQGRLAALASNACGLLRRAGEPINPQTILGVVRSLPPTPWHVDDDTHWQRASFFYHCLVKAHERCESDDPQLIDISAYFVWYFSGDQAAANRIIADAFIAILAEIDAAMAQARG